MDLPSYFVDFLSRIRLRDDHVKELRSVHRTMRQRLESDEDLSKVFVHTFLQGSYRRATAVRPMGDGKADVDVIVVTNLDHNAVEPHDALELFYPFLDTWYEGKWEPQGRSIKVEFSSVKLDLVITAAPSEVEKDRYASASILTEASLEELTDWRLVKSWVDLESRARPGVRELLVLAEREEQWKMEPLLIPDRDASDWQPTNPLEQIRWTWDKNRQSNRHYVNVVKALKWWRYLNPTPKYPKGYPLEHLIGATCPDGITSVAQGITLGLETFVDQYQGYADARQVPYLMDHGVEQNVLRRVSEEEFAAFHALAKNGAKVAREALDASSEKASADAWRRLLGGRFPEAPDRGHGGPSSEGGPDKGGFTPRAAPTVISGGRFA